jgi:ADP-ribose pyrophosphatase YjhB (NUDIX family)
MSPAEHLYLLADELRAIANLGRRYALNDYDRERYEQVLAASARLISVLEQRPYEPILAAFQDNLLHLTPLAGAEAAVFRHNQLLLIQRQDDGLWALPGGLVEVGETLAGAAVRELWEETGLRGRATHLLGIFDSTLWHSRVKAHMYHAVFLVECEPGEPAAGPETLAAAFFRPDDLPPLSAGHHLRVPFLLERRLKGESEPYFDSAG